MLDAVEDERADERKRGGSRRDVPVNEQDRSASDLLAEDRGRLLASLRVVSREEIEELLRDDQVRARIEQGLADVEAGRTISLDESAGLDPGETP